LIGENGSIVFFVKSFCHFIHIEEENNGIPNFYKKGNQGNQREIRKNGSVML